MSFMFGRMVLLAFTLVNLLAISPNFNKAKPTTINVLEIDSFLIIVRLQSLVYKGFIKYVLKFPIISCVIILVDESNFSSI